MNHHRASLDATPMENPLLEYLGIRLTSAGVGRCTFELDVEPRHLNRQASLQGGVTATLLDAACGYAGLSNAEGDVLGHAVTIMLTISYLSKVNTGRVRAVGSVTRSGRSVYFSSAELLTDSDVLVATAQGTFKRSLKASEA